MSTQAEPPRQEFQFSMLLNDTRYRGYTFQVIAILVLAGALFYLMSNLFANLEQRGLELDYGFLGSQANYDIEQLPVEYDSTESHLRASFVGLLNTLIVAVLACATATVLGVVAGVLRLSNNWLVRTLMSAYVEAFRNIPVLIWILIIFTVAIIIFPPPSAYRGDEPEWSMWLGSVAITNRGVYIPVLAFENGLGSYEWMPSVLTDPWKIPMWMPFAGWFEWNISRTLLWLAIPLGVLPLRYFRRWALGRDGEGGALSWLPGSVPFLLSCIVFILPWVIVYLFLLQMNGSTPVPDLRVTFGLTGWLIVLLLFLGLVGSAMIRNWANKVQERTGDRPTIWYFQLLAILGPTILCLFIFGARIDAPSLQGFNFQGGLKLSTRLIGLWLALSVYTAAFIAENVRAGILAINKGQTEAASALGLRPNRVMGLVVLPQAMRVIIPPLISHYLNITKNTSLAIAVGYSDLTATLGGITLNQTGRAIEAVSMLMLFYLTISLLISSGMNVYNKSIALKER